MLIYVGNEKYKIKTKEVEYEKLSISKKVTTLGRQENVKKIIIHINSGTSTTNRKLWNGGNIVTIKD